MKETPNIDREEATVTSASTGNWKRWGPHDEAGALNYISADKVRRAAGLVKTGQVLRLAQMLSPETPVPPHRCGLQHFMVRDGGDYAAGARRPGGFQFAEDVVVMPLHTGTHIDALCHAWYDGRLYNDYPENTLRSTTRAQRLGVEKMPPAFTRGVLLDIVGTKGRALHAGETIGRADLRAAAQRAGISLETGDAVLLHTGWLAAQLGRKDRNDIDFNEEPGIDTDAAMWLMEHEVAMVGADNFAIEALPFPPGTVFPVHQLLIRDHGVPLLEGVLLDALVASGRFEFLFVAAALPIVGATGSPLTPLAIL